MCTDNQCAIYLREACEDRGSTGAFRRKCADLYERLTDHKFVLYLLFLKDVLPSLEIAYKACQCKDVIYESYGQVYIHCCENSFGTCT